VAGKTKGTFTISAILWTAITVNILVAERGLPSLCNEAPEDYPTGTVERWWPNRDLFAYHVPFPEGEMLVFFYPKDGRSHIDSIAPKERYEPYRTKLTQEAR
jgi:hypothetical protein